MDYVNTENRRKREPLSWNPCNDEMKPVFSPILSAEPVLLLGLPRAVKYLNRKKHAYSTKIAIFRALFFKWYMQLKKKKSSIFEFYHSLGNCSPHNLVVNTLEPDLADDLLLIRQINIQVILR